MKHASPIIFCTSSKRGIILRKSQSKSIIDWNNFTQKRNQVNNTLSTPDATKTTLENLNISSKWQKYINLVKLFVTSRFRSWYWCHLSIMKLLLSTTTVLDVFWKYFWTAAILDINYVHFLQFQLDFIPQAELEEAFIYTIHKPIDFSIDF